MSQGISSLFDRKRGIFCQRKGQGKYRRMIWCIFEGFLLPQKQLNKTYSNSRHNTPSITPIDGSHYKTIRCTFRLKLVKGVMCRQHSSTLIRTCCYQSTNYRFCPFPVNSSNVPNPPVSAAILTECLEPLLMVLLAIVNHDQK